MTHTSQIHLYGTPIIVSITIDLGHLDTAGAVLLGTVKTYDLKQPPDEYIPWYRQGCLVEKDSCFANHVVVR